jgi:hypothetical protein
VSAHAPTNSLDATARTVETSIWSSPIGEKEGPDPLSPKVGSRAYRERERRENEQGFGREAEDMVLSNEGVVVEQRLERLEESS